MKNLKTIIGFSLGPVLGALFSAFSVPICTRYLLPSDYGKTSMFNLLYSILLVVIYLGLDQAFIREYREYDNKNKVLCNSMVIPSVVTLLIILLSCPFAPSISLFLFESDKYTDVIYLLLGALPHLLVQRFLLITLRMDEKAFEYSFFVLIFNLISFVATLFFLFYIRQDFLAVVYSTLISLYIGDGILLAFYYKKLFFKKEYLDLELLKRMSKYALPLIPSTVIVGVFSGEDKVFLKYFSDYNELGYYQVSMTLTTMLLILQQAFSTFWTPTVYRWRSENVKIEKYLFVQKVVSIFAFLCFLGVLLIKELIPILLSEKYENIKHVFPFLLFYPVMSIVISTTACGIEFSRKTIYIFYVWIIVAILNFVLNLIFVPKLGATGASIATGLSYIIYFWVITLFSRKLWFNFETLHFVKLILLLLIVALANSLYFIEQTFVYLVDFIVLILGIILYRTTLVRVYNILVKGEQV